MKEPETEIGTIAADTRKERRGRLRLKMLKPVRVRPSNPRHEDEIRTTLNASRDGLYFTTWAEHYYVGMYLGVIFPYSTVDAVNMQSDGRIIRIDRLKDGRFGIAVQISNS
jgi:hypothetical protein